MVLDVHSGNLRAETAEKNCCYIGPYCVCNLLNIDDLQTKLAFFQRSIFSEAHWCCNSSLSEPKYSSRYCLRIPRGDIKMTDSARAP